MQEHGSFSKSGSAFHVELGKDTKKACRLHLQL